MSQHYDVKKSLLIPVNSKKQILIQDRRNYKKPDWGFFGGGIEGDETPLEAVIRESNEELSLELTKDDLIFLGESVTDWNGASIIRYMHLYKTDQESFEDLEGKGAHWLTFDEARERLQIEDRFEDLLEMINKSQ